MIYFCLHGAIVYCMRRELLTQTRYCSQEVYSIYISHSQEVEDSHEPDGHQAHKKQGCLFHVENCSTSLNQANPRKFCVSKKTYGNSCK